MHKGLAIFGRLIRVAGSTIKFCLVDTMTLSTVTSLCRGCRMVTTFNHCRVATTVTIEAFITCHQLIKVKHIMTGRTVVYSVVRCAIRSVVVHCRATITVLISMTDRAVKRITRDSVDAFVAACAITRCVARCCVMSIRNLRLTITHMADFAVINHDVSPGMAFSAG